MKIEWFDRAYIEDYEETSDGYLTFNNVPITRSGVFSYLWNEAVIIHG